MNVAEAKHSSLKLTPFRQRAFVVKNKVDRVCMKSKMKNSGIDTRVKMKSTSVYIKVHENNELLCP